MTKQDILNTTGLSEEEFYQRYPDQESFCSKYPEMCPDMMDDEDMSEEDMSYGEYENMPVSEDEIGMAAYGGSMYKAQDGVETTAPYTDYNQYQNAMQNYGAETSKAGTYNSFQNDLYNQSGTSRGSRETTSQLGDMFNTLSPEQQDALAQKYGAQFMPSSTPSASRRNYVNSMEMNVPGKGSGYYSFPTNDVVYGSKQLERPKYDFPAMTMAPYKMPVAPPKKFSVEPTQLINNISAGYKNPASLNTNNGNLPIPKYSMTNTMEKVGATNKPYVASAPNYTSIIDLLKARKQDSSFTNRKRLAEEAGIKNYTGSASQNMDFINRINGIKSSGTEMELGGANIHPAMRTNFKKGGSKMKYGEFMKYVDYPEMFQEDGMRSYYQPEINSIFFGNPNSIPDELSHAVQNAEERFGYAGAQNYSTMMMRPRIMTDHTDYKYTRENLDPDLVNANAGEYNTIRLKNVPSDSGNSLSNAYVKRYPADYKMAGDAFLKKLNDRNIYMVPGSVEHEAHQLIEPGIRKDYFNYNRPQYKQGGYYGMDGRLHKAKGSGTYVMNGGYYFDEGGATAVAGSTAGASAGSPTIYDNMPNEDGTIDIDPNEQYNFEDTPEEQDVDFGSDGMGNARQQRRRAKRNAPYETPDLGGLYDSPMDEQQPMIEPYDPSQYSTSINPATGFTNYSKGNRALTNIKKQDPALWGQLKEEGNGARWRTGQTDFQKFGKGVDKVADAGQSLINTAGDFGRFLNNRQELKNANSAIINQNSTASQNTNPQAAGKGTGPGQTGSSYGMMDPTSMGARSFTGMYGKYGMEVPKFQPGGGFSNLFPSAQSVVPINSPISLIPNVSFAQAAAPVIDNTAVYRTNQPTNNTSSTMPTGTLDPDAALQAIATFESGSKPGQTKVGMPTKIIGEGGKKASASGTYQITTPTLQDIYKNDKSISSQYDSFNKFKSAFDTDSKVEYQAAKSLMSKNIKDYGLYALGAWYYPEFARKAAAGDKSVFDMVPRRDFGNDVKWGDDFNKKLNAYNKIAGTNYTINTTFNTPKPVAQTAKGNKPHKQQGTSWYADKNRFENPMLRPTLNEVMKLFPGTSLNGIFPSKEHVEQSPDSDHNTGDALDITINNINQGNSVAEKLIKDSKAKNIKYIIFNKKIWTPKTNKWAPYTGKNPHIKHLHASFNPVKKQLGGQVMEMDETEIKQFLKAGGQLEFLD